MKPSVGNICSCLLFVSQTDRGAIRKEKETVKPMEEQMGGVVLGDIGSGIKEAPSPTMEIVLAGDFPLPKHCIFDTASVGVKHVDVPAVAKKHRDKI